MYLDGKVYFNFRIQDYSDFLKPTDIMAFSMKENCGAAGVVFEMAFQTENRKIADLIIENNEVIFELGETAEKALTYKVLIKQTIISMNINLLEQNLNQVKSLDLMMI